MARPDVRRDAANGNAVELKLAIRRRTMPPAGPGRERSAGSLAIDTRSSSPSRHAASKSGMSWQVTIARRAGQVSDRHSGPGVPVCPAQVKEEARRRKAIYVRVPLSALYYATRLFYMGATC